MSKLKFKPLWRKGRDRLLVLTILGSQIPLAWADEPSLGGTDIGAVASKLQGEVQTGKNLMWTVAQFLGVAGVIGGILLWKRIAQERSQKSYLVALGMIAAGAFLYFIQPLMSLIGTSGLQG